MSKDKNQELMDRLNAKIKGVVSDGVVAKFMSAFIANKDYISTGLLTLDKLLQGGWPVGSISLLWGTESSGKSVVALMSAKKTLDEGGVVLYVDTERGLSEHMFKLVGLDPENQSFTRITPANLEELFFVIKNWIRASREIFPDSKILVIWDSYAVTFPKASYERMEEMENDSVAAQAKVANPGIWTLNSMLEPLKIALLIITQARDIIGGASYPGAPKVKIAGCRAVRHAPSTIVMMDDKLKKKLADETFVTHLRPFTEKLRVGQPYQKTNIEVSSEGINDYCKVLEELVKEGKAEKAGTWYTVPDCGKFQGEAKFVDWVKESAENLNLVKKLYNK